MILGDESRISMGNDCGQACDQPSTSTINLNNSINNVLAFSFGRTVQATRPNYRQQPASVTVCNI